MIRYNFLLSGQLQSYCIIGTLESFSWDYKHLTRYMEVFRNELLMLYNAINMGGGGYNIDNRLWDLLIKISKNLRSHM